MSGNFSGEAGGSTARVSRHLCRIAVGLVLPAEVDRWRKQPGYGRKPHTAP